MRGEQRAPLRIEAAAKRIEQASGLKARLPSEKFRHMLLDDRLDARKFRLARFLVLHDDFAEVVDIEEVDVVEALGVRVNIARHAEINDEQSASGPRSHGAFDNRARQNVLGTGNGGDDNVRLVELVFE